MGPGGRVCDLLCTLGTTLVLIDELHNLDPGTRNGAEASDQIKYLSERIPATFVLAGVEIEGTGLFAGRRGGQVAGRYSLITTSPFPTAARKTSGPGTPWSPPWKTPSACTPTSRERWSSSAPTSTSAPAG